MAASTLKTGQTIETGDSRRGIIRYIGPIHIAAGEWCGLELPDASGKNDGSVKGERYFDCPPGHGIFVRKESVVKVLKQPTTTVPSAKTNGATSAAGATKSRPSSIMLTESAKKRQSMLEGGASSQPGSRLSMRSPTKSPSKPTAASSASSNTSTPRTGTPATTARTSDSSAKSRLSTAGRTSMAPPATKPRTTTSTARASVGGQSTVAKASKPSFAPSRPSVAGSRLSTTNKPVAKRTSTVAPKTQREEKPPSPTIEEEEDNDDEEELPSIDAQLARREEVPSNDVPEEQDPEPPKPVGAGTSRTASSSRPNGTGTVEARAAQQKENEQLRVKIRALEKKKQEDEDKLQQIDSLQSDRDRFEGIIQALQKKLKSNQEELKELRAKCEEAEAKVGAAPERSAEFESELELANLDKDMAEERADSLQMELDALKLKTEELELELDVIRSENTELASTMSPEERASAGVLHLERENERLREALILLRDISQQHEGDLKNEVKELQDNLDEAQETSSKYLETTEKLARAEETNRHLMDQLEAAESNEEIVEAMEHQREQQKSQIETLRKQVQELEEHVQVTDELENFHVDEEKRLLAQLDEQEAFILETRKQKEEQDRVVEDLEYTLNKFRGVVQGLQNDIDEARRSREISDLQANEMSSKSKAMMDLNLRLQSSATKTQAKTVDIEMSRVKADLASKHVEILTLFLPPSFESEKNPVLAYLAFGRLRSRAGLVARLLSERLRERGHLSSGEEMLAGCEILERTEWIEGVVDRFERFMATCSAAQFAACGNASYELEPVERTMTNWVEALRRDELGSEGPEHLKRMQGILADLAEKTISDSAEAKANELVARSKMIENYAESAAATLAWLAKSVQARLGPPTDEDEESSVFDKKMDQLGTKARTIRYLCSKVTLELDRIRSSSMCLGETMWPMFEEAEQQAASLSQQIRSIGAAVVEDVAQVDREEPLSYSSVFDTMTKASNHGQGEDDVFTTLMSAASKLQAQVDLLTNKSTDLSTAIEFEPNPAPWVARAKEIRAQKIISSEIQEELQQLQRRNADLATRVSEREKTIEEMTIRVELAEHRMKDTRLKDQQDKALKDEIEELRGEKERAASQLSELQTTMASNKEQMLKDRQELEVLRQGAATNGVNDVAVGKVLVDETLTKHMKAAVKALENEIVGLQSTVRFLRAENKELQVPVEMVRLQAARDAWLDPARLQRGKTRLSTTPAEERQRDAMRREAADVEDSLIEVARGLKPVRLRRKEGQEQTAPGKEDTQKTISSWRSVKDTTRYQVLKQREEVEKWDAWREDLLRQAKLAKHGQKRTQRSRQPAAGRTPNLNGLEKGIEGEHQGPGVVRIIES